VSTIIQSYINKGQKIIKKRLAFFLNIINIISILTKSQRGQNMEIYLKQKQVYGKTLYYPDCGKSEKLAKFRGTKTFSLLDGLALQDIGFKIKFKQINLI